MADNAPVVIWTSGPDTRINFVNQYALTFTGRKFDEVAGGTGGRLYTPKT